MSKEKEIKFDVQKINERNIILTAQNEAGTMCNSIYLWPKEIFDDKSYLPSKSESKAKP